MVDISNMDVNWDTGIAGGPPLWRIGLALGVMVIGLILYILLSRFLPRFLSKTIRNLEKGSKKKKLKHKEKDWLAVELSSQLKEFEKNLKRFIAWAMVLSFTTISFYALGLNVHTEFEMMDYGFTIWMIMKFFITLMIYLLFVRIVLWQIVRLLLQAIFGRSVERKTFIKESKRLKNPLTYLFTIVSIYLAIDGSFPNKESLPYYSIVHIILLISGIILAVHLITILVLFIFRIKYTLPKKIDIHASNALENIIKMLSLVVGLGILLSAFGINPLAIFGAMTFLGVALGFGLQNSIANIMAGFMLAADKPFAVGDRIRVGDENRETWGDVVNIGLNTTRIRTVESDLVVIPNSYIATNEIWNYTRESPVIVHKIDVGISYGSDWRLAKKIMVEEARAHPRVLKKPQPFAVTDKYGESSINFKLWVWLENALDRDHVRSDLLESIKDGFDREGVEIPFPYRTVVQKKNIPKEKRLADPDKFINVRYYPSVGREYFEYGDWHEEKRTRNDPEEHSRIIILVPTVNRETAEKLARFGADFAKKVKGELTALYVMRERSGVQEKKGRDLLNLFEVVGKKLNISVSTALETGDPVDLIVDRAEKNHADFIILGKPEKSGMLSRMKEDIEKEIRARTTVPLIILPD